MIDLAHCRALDARDPLRAMRDRCREVRLDYSRERASRAFARGLLERSDPAQR